MDGQEKRSLSQPGSPSRHGALRSGANHARSYKSPFASPIRATSDLSAKVLSDSSSTQHFTYG